MKNIFQLKKYYYFLFNSSGYYKNGTIIWLIMNTFIKKKNTITNHTQPVIPNIYLNVILLW
jgi:predicted metalloprotease with PDZ domain